MAALTLQKGSADLEAAFTVCKDKKDYRDFEALMRDVEERYEGIYFVTLSELTTKRKIELITAAKRKYGDIAVVFEDYLGMGRETGQNMAEITTRLAKGTKDAAKTCSIPIISMVQARAEGGLDPSTPLDHNSMRDSRTIYIAGDCVFGFWRPFFGKSGLDTKIRGRTLKTRRGVEWKDFQLDWNRSFGSFSTDHDFDGIPGEDAVESKPPAAVG